MSRLGERVGRFTASMLRRVERMAVDASADRPARPEAAQPSSGMPAASSPQPAEAPGPPRSLDVLPIARAEELLDRMTVQAGALAAVLGRRLRQTIALAREEAEDMWADAQQLREEQVRQEQLRRSQGERTE